MLIGAWFDAEKDALRMRIRGAPRAESRRALAHLGRFLQSLDLPALRLIGEAILATLEDANRGEDAVPAVPSGAGAQEPSWPAQPGTSSPPLVILFANPDPAMRRFYWDAFSRSRHDVVVARDAPRFMRRYKALHPDVLISGVVSAEVGAGANMPEGAVPLRPPRRWHLTPWTATAAAQPMTVNHRPAERPHREPAHREAKVGAWFDSGADELHVRMWGAKGGEFRRNLVDLAWAVQSIDLPELRALGQAVEATLAEEERAAGLDDDGDCDYGWGVD